jgi:hypothetical protein
VNEVSDGKSRGTGKLLANAHQQVLRAEENRFRKGTVIVGGIEVLALRAEPKVSNGHLNRKINSLLNRSNYWVGLKIRAFSPTRISKTFWQKIKKPIDNEL